ncbi:MAG: N-acetylmuramoyl-L-alanine amidase [Clostridiales bacterium]|jgi:N-acetylmuramoyl-L-alanine amidase|nr:N-acetylmuramoyl-L-alanine amidase [Clostridiales bacterium]
MKTIVLDAGHGGYDYGAVNGTRYEKDDNLRLARLVAADLRRQGQKVVMTRDSDIFIPLLERSIISNNNNADMFVSLHRNAFINPNANGAETYIQINSPPQNTRYAENILNEIVKAGGLVNRGVKSNNLSVLRNTRAPAVLVETGFISNAQDNADFDAHIDAYAAAVTRGILQSLGLPYNPNGGGYPANRELAAKIQRGLNQTYNAGLSVDGIYGAKTKRALVRALQTELNEVYNARLSADGIFGAKTKNAVRPLKRGAKNNSVYVLQALLFFNGYNISVDGVYGAETENAVRVFQQTRKLSADGIAGANTFEELFK